MPIASLAGRSFGIHQNIIFVHAATLEEAEFKLKISNKVTDTAYKHCIKFPIHGTGQGSGNSPMIWCFISSKLFDCHQKNAHGLLFASPTGDIIIRMSIIGFVDDSTCMAGGDPNQPVKILLSMMQADAQLWSDLLWCSGGKLELPKCGYHVIYYDFENNGIPKMRHRQGLPITLNDAHGAPNPVTPKNIFQQRKNVGHFKAPAGTSVTQYEEIMKKVRSISNAIVRIRVTRDKT